MRRVLVVVAGIVALTASTVASADDPKKADQFCDQLATFRADTDALNQMGPDSTVGDIKGATQKVKDDLKELRNTANRINTPTAQQFVNAVDQLKKQADNVPDDATIASVHQRIDTAVDHAKRTGRQLATESGCPASDQQEQQEQQQP